MFKNNKMAGGFTLVEVIVALACSMIAGMGALSLFTGGLKMAAQSTSLNMNHEETRKVLDRLEREIHTAVSIPALVDVNRLVLNTVGPAEGIAFLRQSGGTRLVTTTADLGATTITLNDGPPVAIGQRLVIPGYDAESDIIGVSGNVLTLAAGLPAQVKVSSTRTIAAIVTDVMSYVVINGELREYQNASTTTYNVVARNVRVRQPFGIPYNPIPE